MKCAYPGCKLFTSIVDTRRKPDGSVARRRECQKHGRFNTVEIVQAKAPKKKLAQ